MAVKTITKKPKVDEKTVDDFISKGGSHPEDAVQKDIDHRLTLRMPVWILEGIDKKRKERVGSISRNLWILEQLEKAVRE